MMLSWCEQKNTPLFIASCIDEYVSEKRRGRSEKVSLPGVNRGQSN